MCIPTIRELPYMTDFLKIAKSIAVHFAHICAYGVETVNPLDHFEGKKCPGKSKGPCYFFNHRCT